MLGVTEETADHPSSPSAAQQAEHTAFSRAADALQRHREHSEVWGDEREAVSIALRWAAAHTTVATDPKTTARSAAELQSDAGEPLPRLGDLEGGPDVFGGDWDGRAGGDHPIHDSSRPAT